MLAAIHRPFKVGWLAAYSGSGFVLFTNSGRGMPLAVPLAYATLPTEHNAFRFAMVG